MVAEVLQICRRCPKRKVRAWAAILQSQDQVQEPATSAKLSQKKINYFLPQSCMELTFFKVPCVKGMNPTSFLPWIRLNVLCWPEGVKLQPPAESHPHSQEPLSFWQSATDIPGFSCERAGTQWKAVPRLLKDLCAPDDICLSSAFWIWSLKLTLWGSSTEFPVIHVSEVWLQQCHWFHSLSSHQQWQNTSVTFQWVLMAQTVKHHLWHKPGHLALSSDKTKFGLWGK